MAWDQPILDISFEAAEDLSADMFHFVVLDATSKKIRLPDTDDEIPVGILQDNPAAGQKGRVRTDGFSKLVAGAGGLAVGALVGPEFVGAADAGKGIAVTIAATIGQPYAHAIVVEPAGAEDDVATVKLRGPIALPVA